MHRKMAKGEAYLPFLREMWPDRSDFVAIDGKTSRRSHDRGNGKAPLHLVSAFATTARLVLGQEAVSDKSNEIIATAITEAGANYLLAVKSNQPTLRAEIKEDFTSAPTEGLSSTTDWDKGRGRIEERQVTVSREVDWLDGDRRINLVRAVADKKTIKLRRKAAG